MREESILPIDIPELQTPFIFRQRPVSIPADLRPAWRIGLVVLLLKNCCRQERTSLRRLHVLSWGFISKEGRNQLVSVANGTLSPEAIVVRVEPFLLQAIDYAIGESLVQREGGKSIVLTPLGKQLATELDSDDSVFSEEKRVMRTIRMKVSDSLVDKMFG